MAIFSTPVLLLVLSTLSSLFAFQITSSRSIFSQTLASPINRGFSALYSTETDEVEDETDSMDEMSSIPTYLPSERGLEILFFFYH